VHGAVFLSMYLFGDRLPGRAPGPAGRVGLARYPYLRPAPGGRCPAEYDQRSTTLDHALRHWSNFLARTPLTRQAHQPTVASPPHSPQRGGRSGSPNGPAPGAQDLGIEEGSSRSKGTRNAPEDGSRDLRQTLGRRRSHAARHVSPLHKGHTMNPPASTLFDPHSLPARAGADHR